MLTDPQREYARTIARTLQIITVAMAAGVLIFLGIVIFMASQKAPAALATEPLLTYVAVGMAIVVVIAWLIVPNIISTRLRQSLIDGRFSDRSLAKNIPNVAELGDVVPLSAIYQTRTIVAVALLEGAAFMSTVAYMLEHQELALYLAVVLAFLILSQAPSVSRLETWVEGELAGIEQLRQMR